jgi:hypothetical protein
MYDLTQLERQGKEKKKRKGKIKGKLCIVCHNGEKLLLVNLSVLIEVKFIYHRLPGEWKNKG